jgi:hypothetical protein
MLMMQQTMFFGNIYQTVSNQYVVNPCKPNKKILQLGMVCFLGMVLPVYRIPNLVTS